MSTTGAPPRDKLPLGWISPAEGCERRRSCIDLPSARSSVGRSEAGWCHARLSQPFRVL